MILILVRGIRLNHRFGFDLKPRPPFDFELIVHKPTGWSLFTTSEIFEKGTLWTALYINGALTGLKLRSRGTTEKPLVKADVFLRYPAGSEQKKEIRRALIEKLTADEDLAGFCALAKKDPILKYTIDDLYGMHDTDPGTLFADATLAILLQMAPLKRSEEMMECVIRSYGDLAEFDGKRVYTRPTPETIARLSVQKLGKCKLGYRAKRLLKLARVLETGDFPTLEEVGTAHSRRGEEEAPRAPRHRRLLSRHTQFPQGFPYRRMVGGRIRETVLWKGVRGREERHRWDKGRGDP